MTEKTTDYSIFIFRDDNRDTIKQVDVKRLIESIKAKNLLEFRPILVNEKYEIIDGQHRVLAAKELNVPIYYTIEKSLNADDIIRMNIAKSWLISDYMNFYVKNGYEEYIKLQGFMKKHNLSLKIAIAIIQGRNKKATISFKDGKFKFQEEVFIHEIDACWDTIALINKLNGYSLYTGSSRFWNPLLKLVKHPDFKIEKWLENISKMSDRFTIKVSTKDYLKLFSDVYNWRNSAKIDLLEASYEQEKPRGLNIIAMADVEFIIKNRAYSLHLPVYYRKDPETFMLFFDYDKKTTIITHADSMYALREEFKKNLENHFKDIK